MAGVLPHQRLLDAECGTLPLWLALQQQNAPLILQGAPPHALWRLVTRWSVVGWADGGDRTVDETVEQGAQLARLRQNVQQRLAGQSPRALAGCHAPGNPVEAGQPVPESIAQNHRKRLVEGDWAVEREAGDSLAGASIVIKAIEEVKVPVPLVVRLEGTNVEKGKEILSKSGLKITAADDLADAAKKVVAAAKSV